jgi:hypothetical protein
MFFRQIEVELEKWAAKPGRKPLILRGARQVWIRPRWSISLEKNLTIICMLILRNRKIISKNW